MCTPCPGRKRKRVDADSSTLTPADRTWRLLRQPFPLPLSAAPHHKCEWEIFDLRRAGCLLCSAIHVCERGRCKDIIETEEAEVCAVTGVVLGGIFHSDEFHDTILQRNNPHLNSNDNTKIDEALIESYVKELLNSVKSREAFDVHFSKLLHWLHRNLAEQLENSTDVFDAITKAVVDIGGSRTFSFQYNKPKRKHLIRECCLQIWEILRGSSNLRLNLKCGDLRNTIFGLVFLLKQGVYAGCMPIVLRIADLDRFLPNEGQLFRFFNFRAKYITDIENKYKFAYRIKQAATCN